MGTGTRHRSWLLASQGVWSVGLTGPNRMDLPRTCWAGLGWASQQSYRKPVLRWEGIGVQMILDRWSIVRGWDMYVDVDVGCAGRGPSC